MKQKNGCMRCCVIVFLKPENTSKTNKIHPVGWKWFVWHHAAKSPESPASSSESPSRGRSRQGYGLSLESSGSRFEAFFQKYSSTRMVRPKRGWGKRKHRVEIRQNVLRVVVPHDSWPCLSFLQEEQPYAPVFKRSCQHVSCAGRRKTANSSPPCAPPWASPPPRFQSDAAQCGPPPARRLWKENIFWKENRLVELLILKQLTLWISMWPYQKDKSNSLETNGVVFFLSHLSLTSLTIVCCSSCAVPPFAKDLSSWFTNDSTWLSWF